MLGEPGDEAIDLALQTVASALRQCPERSVDVS
jgi:hypothetical protein